MTADDRVSTALHQAAEDARDRKGHRWMWAGLLVALAGLLWLFAQNLSNGNEISALEQQQRDAAEAAQTLAGQVRALGGTPLVQPPAPGERGEAGRDGQNGTNGRDGVDGVTPACLSEPAQCRGADGQPGKDGVDGKDGTNGTNGVDGQDGKDGVDGQPGQNGRDGSPASSITIVDEGGNRQECPRDPSSPDTAPTYDCTRSPAGPPGTTTSNPLLRIGG